MEPEWAAPRPASKLQNVFLQRRGHGLTISVPRALHCSCYILSLSKYHFDEWIKKHRMGRQQLWVREAQFEEQIGVQAQPGNSILDILGPQWLTGLVFSLNRPNWGWGSGEHVRVLWNHGYHELVEAQAICMPPKVFKFGCTPYHQIHTNLFLPLEHRFKGPSASDGRPQMTPARRSLAS